MIEELLRRIDARIADMACRSDADHVGPLSYSAIRQRRVAADCIRIEELHWVQDQVAELVAGDPKVAYLASMDETTADLYRATEALAFVSDLRSVKMYIDRLLSEIETP